jgi:hypothetical protein
MKAIRFGRIGFVICLTAIGTLLGGAGSTLLGTSGPFTDVAADAFRPFVLDIYYLGITTGTSPTTYDPTSNVGRDFLSARLTFERSPS